MAVTTLDPRSSLPLIVDNGTSRTIILYGQAAIGEYTTQWRYYLGDAQLSVRQLVDESGSVTQAQTYAPYGVLLNQAGDGGGLFGYKGGQSSTNGLWYFGNGYFDPNTGQFISANGNPLSPLAAASPVGLLFAPILFIGWRRRKGKKRIHPATLLFLGVLLAATLSSCGEGGSSENITVTETAPPEGTGTELPGTEIPPVTSTPPAPNPTAEPIPTIAPTPTPCPTPDPTQPPSPTPLPIIPLVEFFETSMWTNQEMAVVRAGALQVANALFTASGGLFSSAQDAFLAVYGGTVTFEKTGVQEDYLGEATSQTHILVNEHKLVSITSPTTGALWAAHELGHAFNYALSPNTTDNLTYGQGIIDLALEGVYADVNDDGLLDQIAGNTTQSYANDNLYIRTDYGYLPGINPGGTGPYQQNDTQAVSEDFADMFMNWTFDEFATNKAGDARYDFMNNHMANWIDLAVINNQ